MRKTYVTPTMSIEAFQPTEYVAVCAPDDYKLTCIPGDIYMETNNMDKLQTEPGISADGKAYEADNGPIAHPTCESEHTIRWWEVGALWPNLFSNFYVKRADGSTEKVYACNYFWNGTNHYFKYVPVANHS